MVMTMLRDSVANVSLPVQMFAEEALVPTMQVTVVAGALGALLFGAFHFAESKAAMRGRKGQPMPVWVEKLMRVFFLAVLMGPMCYLVDVCLLGWPVLTLACMLYAIPYTDLSEQNGGKTPRLRRCPMWNIAKRYFSVDLVRTCPLDPEKQYIFAIHPHGILPFGSTIAMCRERPGGFKDLFPGINFKTLVATFGFFVPLYREFLLYTGMADAARFSAKKLLDDKVSIALVPGGATEALYVSPEKDVLYLKNRKGFIKLALEHGTAIVPVYSFNENSTYRLYQGGNKLLNSFKLRFQRITGLSVPLVLNVLPRKVRITVVIGQPVEMPKIENPTPQQVEHHLDLYITKLKELYNANKDKYNEFKNKELVIL